MAVASIREFHQPNVRGACAGWGYLFAAQDTQILVSNEMESKSYELSPYLLEKAISTIFLVGNYLAVALVDRIQLYSVFNEDDGISIAVPAARVHEYALAVFFPYPHPKTGNMCTLASDGQINTLCPDGEFIIQGRVQNGRSIAHWDSSLYVGTKDGSIVVFEEEEDEEADLPLLEVSKGSIECILPHKDYLFFLTDQQVKVANKDGTLIQTLCYGSLIGLYREEVLISSADVGLQVYCHEREEFLYTVSTNINPNALCFVGGDNLIYIVTLGAGIPTTDED